MTTVRKLFEGALALLDAGDVDGFVGCFEPDGEFVHPQAAVEGPEQIRAFIGMSVRAFPDGHHELRDVLEDGDTVVVAGDWTGTHTGPLPTPAGELPGTGRQVRVSFAALARIHDGRIRRAQVYSDQLAFMAQLGLLPTPATD